MVVDVTESMQYRATEPIIEASSITDMDVFLDTICASADCYDESAIDDIRSYTMNVADLWKQWKKYTDTFVKHKWIYRYIDDKQKKQLEKHYAILCDEKTNYSTYKKSFAAIAKFLGLPNNTIIIENIIFSKDKKDKEQDIIAVKYSKGVAKVTIPSGIRLIHTTMVDIDAMKPAFRSKTKGKYLYPSKRCFFTCIKAIASNKAGLEHQKLHKYTPKTPITEAYIDPTYADFGSNSVYVETENPIPVENFYSLIDKIANRLSHDKEGK